MDPLHIAPSLLQELIGKLTPRQVEIVEHLAQGRTGREIATLLSISRETVKSHIAKACSKTGAENRIQLIVMYAIWRIQNGN
jgi:DNA-binding NarL/FixJ family response regulator